MFHKTTHLERIAHLEDARLLAILSNRPDAEEAQRLLSMAKAIDNMARQMPTGLCGHQIYLHGRRHQAADEFSN